MTECPVCASIQIVYVVGPRPTTCYYCGATWVQDGTFSGTQADVDKPWLWIDHSLTSPFLNNIYTIYHNGNPNFVSRRTSSTVYGSTSSSSRRGGLASVAGLLVMWPRRTASLSAVRPARST